MRIAVISDLHLGNRDASDSFGHDDTEFLRFLDHLEHQYERVVLLGDIWETLTPRSFGQTLEALAAAQAAHPELKRRFERRCYQYVHGNHDLILSRFGAPLYVMVEAHGLRILMTHGHVFDWLTRRARWLSELGVFAGGWLRRLDCPRLYRSLDAWDQRRTNPDPSSASPDRFQRWAMAMATAHDADAIVTGHTHVSAVVQHGARLFINSGSCSEGRFSYVSIDTRHARFQVCSQWPPSPMQP